ncbi:MAG: acyl-CoA dehydrogenase family protein, partial [Acidimicrobiia bacterium]
PEQKEQFLRPLATGACRSCFAMTEPAPGAGSDPSMLQTEVRRDGDECIINGLKWLITGASGARYAICMARVEGTSGRDSKATMLLVPMDTPGVTIERDLDTMDSSFTGGHGVVRFTDVHVPAANILGEWGEGMRYAQVRLAPARLTHCMRWLGAARRAHDVAAAYAAEREAFGQKLGRHEGVSYMLADNEIAIRAARMQIWHTAWLLDQGADGGYESSIAKTFVSESVWGVVDRSLQILGGRGITRETVVERIFRDVRAFRIYDGPSEVHRWSVGRRIVKAAGA